MKKIAAVFLFFILAAAAGGWHLSGTDAHKEETLTYGTDTLYVNVNAIKVSELYLEMQKLAQALKKEGHQVVLSGKGDFKSGGFNLYIAKDINSLPKVLDRSAINILWLPTVQDADGPERLRPFDVIVVKSMLGFNYLKAINVRTAYIPDAIDIKGKGGSPNRKAMFYGENTGLVLPLYLAGRNDLSVDVFGKNFEANWPLSEIKGDMPEKADFGRYSLVLLDQSEKLIRDGLIDKKIIETVENGGLPYLRFNPGVYKVFGETVPMYHSEQEFISGMAQLKNNPELVRQMRAGIQQAAKKWDSMSQAKKFIELFKIMQQKRR